jgi:hypothetical protein
MVKDLVRHPPHPTAQERTRHHRTELLTAGLKTGLILQPHWLAKPTDAQHPGAPLKRLATLVNLRFFNRLCDRMDKLPIDHCDPVRRAAYKAHAAIHE